MFEKPKIIVSKSGPLRIVVAEDHAAQLIRDMATEGLASQVAATDLKYSNPGDENGEKITVIDITSGTESQVRKFLRNRT